MFTVIVSGVGNGVRWTQVKTKNSVEKVRKHLISCLENRPFSHHDRSRDSQAAVAIRCGSSGTYHTGTIEQH